MKIKTKQIIFMYLDNIFTKQALFDYVLVSFYLKKLSIGLDQYLFLDMILFLVMSLFEVPSGYISDKFGKKKVLIIAKIIVVLTMTHFIFANDFLSRLINIIVLGIGVALGSGNSMAILFDYFSSHNEMEEYKRIIPNISTVSIIVAMSFSLLSGIIFSFNYIYILYIDIAIYVINIIATAIFLVEDKSIILEEAQKRGKPEKIKIGLNTILGFVAVAFLIVYSRVTFNYYQPIYTDLKIDYKYFGLFPIAFNIIGILSQQAFKKWLVDKVDYDYKSLSFVYIVIFITSIFISFFGNILVIFFILLLIQQMIMAFRGNVTGIYLNNQIPKLTEYRSTYFSVYNLIYTGLISLSLFVSGLALKIFTVYQQFLIVGIIVCSIGMTCLILNKVRKKRNRIKKCTFR